jgi:lipopolysaccharide transport protein LptA
MAATRASRTVAGTLLATLAASAGAAEPPAAAPPPHPLPVLAADQPIELEAGSSDFDYRNNRLVFQRIRIAQGDLAVEADEATATGLDFKSGLWVFRGHVRISVPDGYLSSDEAQVAFAANAITTANATGSPATFEQKRDKSVARGRAGHIDYDFVAATVRLTEDAWLSDGENEITGQTLVYSFKDQHIRANPDEQGGQRVRITINPRKNAPQPNP